MNNIKDNPKPIAWTTEQIIKATNGIPEFGAYEKIFDNISIDSRTILPNDFFIAIKGENHDGHSFVQDVIKKGIKGLIIEKNYFEKLSHDQKAGLQADDILLIIVKNTIDALADLARFQRKRANVSVIAITGSNGKTTTKEMTATIMSTQFKTLSTSGNFNNEIGLPLTLLNLSDEHEWAVVELGMNHPGEISKLAQICLPDIGIITCIAPAHLQGLGSIQGVAKAKVELFENINSQGVSILNGDDPILCEIATKRSKSKNLITFGFNSDLFEVTASEIKKDNIKSSFILNIQDKNIQINLQVPGDFMIANSLAAASAAYTAGVNLQNIKKGLELFKPVSGRMNIFKTQNNINIIDDTYNANPGSMAAAINTLNFLSKNSRSIIVIGDMLELGDDSENLHKQIGALAANLKIDQLYVTGAFAKNVVNGALENKMPKESIFMGNKDEIIQKLLYKIQKQDWILVKGSRGMKMEQIVNAIKS